ncbi:MAG: DUF2226 domain-containing protein [Candidatus Micrarchaeota archaeon]|nr:DUF2226 domain-containing protein [Candidatus Micrarchaeota archaeon]
MNLPSGAPVKTGIDVASVDFPALLHELLKKGFSGYLCIAVQGAGGIEEGTLLFDGKKISGGFYEYFKHNKILMGKDAWARVLNAAGAEQGVVDIYQLSSEQVELVLAFNEQAIWVPSEKELRELKTASFSPALEEQAKGMRKEEKEDLLKKYKLAGVGEPRKAEAGGAAGAVAGAAGAEEAFSALMEKKPGAKQ